MEGENTTVILFSYQLADLPLTLELVLVCVHCRKRLPSHAFDFVDERPNLACRVCAPVRAPVTPRLVLHDRLVELERQRRPHLAALAQIAAEYAELRRPHIAALVKIDAEIADLRAQLSASFVRVEPSEIFEADGSDVFGD